MSWGERWAGWPHIDLNFERDDLTDYAAALNDRPVSVPTRRENTVGVLLLVAAALVGVCVCVWRFGWPR